MAKTNTRLPVALPNPIKEALERKKQQTGFSYNTIIVLALEQYLGPPRKAQRSDE